MTPDEYLHSFHCTAPQIVWTTFASDTYVNYMWGWLIESHPCIWPKPDFGYDIYAQNYALGQN